MKYNSLIHTFLLLSSGLAMMSGCNQIKDDKTHITYGSYISSDLIEIESYGDLKTKLAIKNEDTNIVEGNKENFLLCVYRKGCSCWSTFEHNVLEPYNKKNHTMIYKMNAELFASSYDKFGIDIRSDRETFVIVENGVVKTQAVYDESNKIFKDLDVFTNWMEKKVTLPTMYYIDKAYLDNLYLGTTSFVVELGRKTCPDCCYVDYNALKDYANEHTNAKEMYLFDVDEVRLNAQGEVKTEEWNEFKAEYGLDNTNNKTFGYETGFVPSFLYVEPTGNGEKISTIKSMSVYVNDTISKVDDVYKITQTYYTEERLEVLDYAKNVKNNILTGLEIPTDDLNIYQEWNYYAWKYEAAAKYHTPLLYAFLDKYTK